MFERMAKKEIIVVKESTEVNTNRDNLPQVSADDKIFTIRGIQVIVDRDLAELYGVETKRLNQQANRNIKRFPASFRFQLSVREKDELVANCNRFETLKHSSSLPYVFYDGQIYDSYTFVGSLIKSATKSIILIDNYIDETVLTMLDKRSPGVNATIYTQKISSQFQLDIAKHDAQYPAIPIKVFTKAHDRFLIIDDKVYHIGASLKDMGKKWFVFSLMEDMSPDELISRL